MGKSPHHKLTVRADSPTFKAIKTHLALKGISFQVWAERKMQEDLAKNPFFSRSKVNEELK